MDDLTKLPLIGPATAKKLVAAGIDTFAKVAGAGHADLRAVLTSATPDGLQTLQESAIGLSGAPAPVDLANATPDQVKNQAALIDAARARLAAAQGAIDAAKGNDEVDQAALSAELAAAQQALDMLIGPGADRAHQDTETTSTHTTQSEAEDEGEVGELAAGLPGPEALEELDRSFASAMAALEQHVHTVLDQEGLRSALDYLSGQRGLVNGVIEHMNKTGAEIDRLKLQLLNDASTDPEQTFAIVVTGPRKGRWRAGHHFGPHETPVHVSAAQLEEIEADPALSWALASKGA